ncbi:outer membrane beta-barrel protein [Polynucleobacter sp. JS-Safj-400b-B2]|uniref:outer membrane beta-barrel protein n=1 Tax=Polynucleobacter sp. JS-Safj-400b-B2 TaxID=2576921 RepID=UPI001C0B5937|nr:outer membrane beta-barrel protein [Polynucleobacter sp. JS-Safj-400b-B2]MBU3625949.1 outer membrane beta-barrel protein [Polynucleobacter sp. JS-Safj-400b-B2]
MRSTVLVAAIAATVLSTGAMAQVSHRFEGFDAQIGVGVQDSNFKSNNVLMGGKNYQASNSSEVQVPTSFGIGYMTSLDSRYLLGVSADYGFNRLGAGNYTLSGTGPAKCSTGNVALRNPINLSLVPAYALSSTSLLYAKVGYENTQFGINGDYHSINGLALGIGDKQYITDNIYGYVEANYIANNKSNFANSDGGVYQVQSQNYNLMMGLGYKF